MSLAPGTRIGSYEVVSIVGAGGMGEVYRARDTRLRRDVAVKILPARFADDPERLARFEREAQVLASLTHPLIASIHGFEEHDRIHALVLEFVEGETLADRIARGPVPLDEALPIARQIAEALEAAHEHGIVHRDLKPANIKITPDGAVKVLDFGLAKLADPSSVSAMPTPLSVSPTITSPALMTQAGMLLGTAAYMETATIGFRRKAVSASSSTCRRPRACRLPSRSFSTGASRHRHSNWSTRQGRDVHTCPSSPSATTMPAPSSAPTGALAAMESGDGGNARGPGQRRHGRRLHAALVDLSLSGGARSAGALRRARVAPKSFGTITEFSRGASVGRRRWLHPIDARQAHLSGHAPIGRFKRPQK